MAKNANSFDQFRSLLTDGHFIELRKLTGNFSIFDAMGAAYTEIKHSNILAWLLNPYETHGWGEAFLREFVMIISSILNDVGLDFYQVYTLDIEYVEVIREWPRRTVKAKEDAYLVSENEEPVNEESDASQSKTSRGRIDIVIEITYRVKDEKACEPNHENHPVSDAFALKKIVIAIENKIRSSESVKNGETQLSRYWKDLEKAYRDKAVIVPIFLTPDGTLPKEEDNWKALKYTDVKNAIQNVYDLNFTNLTGDKQMFIRQYLALLSEKIVSGIGTEHQANFRALNKDHIEALELIRIQNQPSKADDKEPLHHLCQHIYKSNLAVFRLYNDWLFETRGQMYMALRDSIEQYCGEDIHGLTITQDKEHYIEFIDPVLKEVSTKLFEREDGIVFYIHNGLNYNIKVYMQIQENKNQRLRKDIYDVFKYGPDIFRSSDTIRTKRYTRVYSYPICTHKLAIVEQSIDALIKLVKSNLDAFFSETGDYKKIRAFMEENKKSFLAFGN